MILFGKDDKEKKASSVKVQEEVKEIAKETAKEVPEETAKEISEETTSEEIESQEKELKTPDSEEVEISTPSEGNKMEEIIELAEKEEKNEVKKEESENNDNIKDNEDIINKILAENFIKEHKAKFHKGSLRSGVSLNYDGSIIVLGDVNPGAQIVATGNILVLGALRGIAHAGCKGEKQAYVFALNMNPVQLRITDVITRFPESGRNRVDIIPEYAYLEDGKVYVSTF